MLFGALLYLRRYSLAIAPLAGQGKSCFNAERELLWPS
jgi:hypothetical protein